MSEQKERVILHSDLNAFYASAETVLHPEYRGRAIAVCGSTAERRGIVLAKSELAKRAGVKTGMINAEALSLCPGLILVPPHHEIYAEFSRKVRRIYECYTDQVEAFGMDECWLDVTGSTRLFGSGEEIAEEIRERVKKELGLTVSVGVSFNKIFAKLASDMKKPDAVTVVSRENFKEKIFPLPVSDLLYVGRATTKKLNAWGIYTIGQLAASDLKLLEDLLGVNGKSLWTFANGLDTSRVSHKDYESPLQSMSHGMTCAEDLCNNEMVWRLILELAVTIGGRLRREGLSALGVEVYIAHNDLGGEHYRTAFSEPTQSPLVIAGAARDLFERNYRWLRTVRALTLTLLPLCPENQPFQQNFFCDTEKLARREKVDRTVDSLCQRFGKHALIPAELLRPLPLPKEQDHEAILPGMMYR